MSILNPPTRLTAGIALLSIATLPAGGADYTSAGSGNWMTETNWSPVFPTPGQGPYVGESNGGAGLDNATIGSGHTITIDGTYHGTGDLAIRGSTVTVAGGILQQSGTGQWFRLGQTQDGTINITDGTLNIGSASNMATGLAGANATLIVGDGTGAANSATLDIDNAELRIGDNTSGAPGNTTVTINSDGRIINGKLDMSIGGGTSTMIVNGGSYSTQGGNITMELGNNGPAHVEVHGDGAINHNGGWGIVLGRNAGAAGSSLELHENGSFNAPTADTFWVGAAGDASITMDGNSTLLMDRSIGNSNSALQFGRNAGVTGTLDISENATLTSDMVMLVGRSGNGIVNHSGNATVQVNNWMAISHTAGTARGTYNLTGGTLNVTDTLVLGERGQGILQQDGGDITIGNQFRSGYTSNGGLGTYNFEGGTLKVDSIDFTFQGATGGTFNWGGGTLGLRTTNSAQGTTDYNNASVAAQTVQVGSALTFDGSTTTGFNSGASTLDLNELYINDGVRFNQLNVLGTLDLSGANDTLDVSINPYLLRPNIGLAEAYGSLPLVTAGTLIDEFDNFTTPLQDNIGWSEFTGSFTSAAALPLNSWYLEHNAGTGEVLFHYKVEGTVPEPGTTGLLALGILWMRGLKRRRHRA